MFTFIDCLFGLSFGKFENTLDLTKVKMIIVLKFIYKNLKLNQKT